MSAPELAEKRCTKCGETKPLSGFHRNRRAADGHHYWCKPCMTAYTNERAAIRRAEMGEEAWLAHQREITRRHRERTKNAKGKEYQAAKNRAISVLMERHRTEFEHLLLLARRGELEAVGASS